MMTNKEYILTNIGLLKILKGKIINLENTARYWEAMFCYRVTTEYLIKTCYALLCYEIKSQNENSNISAYEILESKKGILNDKPGNNLLETLFFNGRTIYLNNSKDAHNIKNYITLLCKYNNRYIEGFTEESLYDNGYRILSERSIHNFNEISFFEYNRFCALFDKINKRISELSNWVYADILGIHADEDFKTSISNYYQNITKAYEDAKNYVDIIDGGIRSCKRLSNSHIERVKALLQDKTSLQNITTVINAIESDDESVIDILTRIKNEINTPTGVPSKLKIAINIKDQEFSMCMYSFLTQMMNDLEIKNILEIIQISDNNNIGCYDFYIQDHEDNLSDDLLNKNLIILRSSSERPLQLHHGVCVTIITDRNHFITQSNNNWNIKQTILTPGIEELLQYISNTIFHKMVFEKISVVHTKILNIVQNVIEKEDVKITSLETLQKKARENHKTALEDFDDAEKDMYSDLIYEVYSLRTKYLEKVNSGILGGIFISSSAINELQQNLKKDVDFLYKKYGKKVTDMNKEAIKMSFNQYKNISIPGWKKYYNIAVPVTIEGLFKALPIIGLSAGGIGLLASGLFQFYKNIKDKNALKEYIENILVPEKIWRDISLQIRNNKVKLKSAFDTFNKSTITLIKLRKDIKDNCVSIFNQIVEMQFLMILRMLGFPSDNIIMTDILILEGNSIEIKTDTPEVYTNQLKDKLLTSFQAVSLKITKR